MAIDWHDLRHSNDLVFQVISPTNLNVVVGELEGVIRASSSLTAEYYSDTRTSGTITVVGDNWSSVRGSFIRVIHRIPEWDYERVLGTYLVSDDDAKRNNGAWETTLTLHSMLYALSLEKQPAVKTVASGASVLTAMREVLNQSKRAYVEKSAKDKRLTSALALELGKSQLERMFSLSESSGNRLDVDGYGRVTIAPYVEPANRPAEWTLDLADKRGIVVDGISRSADYLELPGVAVVHCEYTETVNNKSVKRTITQSATASGNLSPASRGYTITDWHDENDLNPKTAAHAQELAASYLKKNTRELCTWDLSTTYLPIWEGDIINLVVHDGPSYYQGVRKCFVKSLSLDLETMGLKLTLKETTSGDDEE